MDYPDIYLYDGGMYLERPEVGNLDYGYDPLDKWAIVDARL